MSKLLILVLALSFALPAFADDDEMKTETKGTNGAPVEKNPFAEPPKGASAPSKLDPQLRAKIRAKAPFWIDDTAHGAAIRINKDGTLSSENQGGGSIAGSWKAMKGGHLEITSSGETYTYSVSASGGKVQINGKSATKGRYKLN
jgi:hypothetical protein